MNPERLREARAGFLADHRLRGRQFCEAYTRAVDGWLADGLAAAIRRTNRRPLTGIALIAVGSYGRRELCPGSDLDLVLVHDNIKGIGTIADALWYPVWDAGLQLDHSVRTPRETVAVAREDLKAALGLLNARFVAGDEQLSSHVRAQVRRRWVAEPRESLRKLRGSLEERWTQHGELAFLMEPDLKLAHGGLRDIEALQAVALATPIIASSLEDPRMTEAADTLLRARVALHVATSRRGDRLLVEDQDAVAQRLGLGGADELIAGVARAARRIAWVSDQSWRTIDARLAHPRRVAQEQQLEHGIVLKNQELAFDESVDLRKDSALPFRVAAASARTGIPIGASALTRLESESIAPRDPWPHETLDALLDLLGCGHAAIPLLETLDQLDVIPHYIPEWSGVRGRSSAHSGHLHHRFTVDRHLLETVAAAADLSRSVARPDLLLIAAWLYELSAGVPDADAQTLMATVAMRMGFADADASTLGRLVRDSRLLADTATRRDLEDPATIDAVAARVGTHEALNLLAALTHASSLATSPAAWNAWNTRLVDELVERTRAHLAGERAEPIAPTATPEQRELIARGELAIVAEDSRVTVVAPDRPGVLATVAGVFAVNRLPVRSMTGMSESGMVVDVFDLDLTNNESPDWNRITSHLADGLKDPATLAARLERRARSGRMPIRPGAARLAAPRVLIDNASTPRASIVEVRTADSLGILSRIARTIAERGCDIRFVRALTLGHEVVDSFYVIDSDTGAKLSDEARLVALQDAILNELHEGTAGRALFG